MAMCLAATYPEYLNRIYDGSYRPKKPVVAVPGETNNMIDKEKKNYTPEDLTSILKDAKMFEWIIRRVHDHPSGCLVDHPSGSFVDHPSGSYLTLDFILFMQN
ncbi:hypothetical protein AgCh_028749 [Apium graveolens]